MAYFNPAVEFVLKNEGGFVDNVSDPGGATNFGVSLRLLRSLSVEVLRRIGVFRMGEALTVNDIENLTSPQAELVYKFAFWDQAPFDKIQDQDICNYLFDCAVLHGINQAVKLIQRALWSVYRNINYQSIIDDGLLGDGTIGLINATTTRSIFMALMAERAGLMRLIVAERPKDREFLNGWLERCYRI